MGVCVCACVFVYFARVCVCVCVCDCVRTYHGRFSMFTFEMESNERSNCHGGICECELQMQVRRL